MLIRLRTSNSPGVTILRYKLDSNNISEKFLYEYDEFLYFDTE